MTKIKIAVLIISSLAATNVQSARSADLPERPKHPNVSRQRDAATELLYQQFYEWQKKQALKKLFQNDTSLQLRGAIR